jgi:threonine aldolase
MDGARVFNAATALGVTVARLTQQVDTVMFCLSKGLGAPVGSMLVGPSGLIGQGRLYRKRLGGGMRQAGVLAAAGLIALEQMPARLGADHDNAGLLAEGLARIPGVAIDPASVRTNIVIFDVAGTGLSAQAFSAGLKQRGVLANAVSPTRMRFVTHYDVSRAQCEAALEAAAEMTAAAAR